MSKIHLNFSFKKRSVNFYLSLIGVVLILIGSLTFFIIDKTVFQGNTNFTDNSHITFILLLSGALVGIAGLITEIYPLNILTSVLYALGIGQHLYLTMFPWADLFKGVPFFVSDKISVSLVFNTFLIFLIVFLIGDICSIVSCFIFKRSPKAETKLTSSKA